MTEPFFPGNFIFPQILAKIAPNDRKIGLFGFFEKFCHYFFWKYIKMKTGIIINISPPITYLAKFCFSSYGQKYCWPMELQDSLKCNISRKKWMMKFILFFSSKFSTRWYHHSGCAYPDMSEVPKIRSFHIFAISLRKS